MIERGLLSSLQLETVVYAGQRHGIFGDDGVRSGFLLGDGAGMGKGRQIAGIIYDNYIRGRKKHVWLSASADLADDARRDLSDIGASKMPVCNLNDMRYGDLRREFGNGTLFCTYSCLIGSKGGKDLKETRIDQVVQWCGGAQVGVSICNPTVSPC